MKLTIETSPEEMLITYPNGDVWIGVKEEDWELVKNVLIEAIMDKEEIDK